MSRGMRRISFEEIEQTARLLGKKDSHEEASAAESEPAAESPLVADARRRAASTDMESLLIADARRRAAVANQIK